MHKERIDYYIALVGTNPLPDYISALNFCDEDTVIYLVYTNEDNRIISSRVLAERIKEAIVKKKCCKNIKFKSCDKSEFKSISTVIEEVFKDIREHSKYKDIGDNRKKIVLDYTGGTKAMSAIFYSKFKEFEKDCHNNKFIFMFSYVENNERKILYENLMRVECSKFTEIAKDNNITIKDVLSLHGYNIENGNEEILQGDIRKCSNGNDKLILKSNRAKDISQDGIYLKDFTICVYKISQKNTNDSCKHELFILKDEAEKIGGSEACIFYKYCFNDKDLNGKDKDKEQKFNEKIQLRDTLKKEFVNTCSINMEGRILILNNYCNEEEEIKNFYTNIE